MLINKNLEIQKKYVEKNITRLINQTYKLLPNREEELDWITPLSTIIEELSGMASLMDSYQENIFSILCKLEGLKGLQNKEDFFLYRRTILECLNLLSVFREEILKCQE